ncbi:Pentatricopeptide repeat-containing protein [Abeliophyllum distichum]|uniref:Pentatricopeptide repeat-containing protein n=1 Tax=Abeliophyllum distichum TaxID=126358 RepID=A0ABD1VCD5_9LAMI
MPMRADVGVLGALLGACRIHGNIDLGEEIGRQVIELEPTNSGLYVLLANLYARAGSWEDVANIRKLMNDRGVKKAPGCTAIDLEGAINELLLEEGLIPKLKRYMLKLKKCWIPLEL